MARYFSIFLAFFKTSAVADLEFRANLALKVFTDLIWYLAQMLTFEILYRHTTLIGGWTVEQVRVFMTLLFMADALFMILFSENMDQLGVKVLKGELDFVLTKPIDSQFMVSFMRINTPYVVNFTMVSMLFLVAAHQLPGGIPWPRLALLFVVVPCGVMVLYFSKLIFACSALFFGTSNGVSMVWYQLYRLGTRPDVIYPRLLRILVLTVLPMAFVASVPARVVVDPLSYKLVIGSAVVGVTSMVLSRFFWTFALRRYASASS